MSPILLTFCLVGQITGPRYESLDVREQGVRIFFSARERAIEDSLHRTASFSFDDLPLHEFAEMIEQRYGVPVNLDKPALADAGVKTSTQLTANMHGVSLRGALRAILRGADPPLDYVIEHDYLWITTKDMADYGLRTGVYVVDHLVYPASEWGQPVEPDFESLIELITTTIRPDSWADNGGVCTIREFEGGRGGVGSLVISANLTVHQEVADLLERLEEVDRTWGPTFRGRATATVLRPRPMAADESSYADGRRTRARSTTNRRPRAMMPKYHD